MWSFYTKKTSKQINNRRNVGLFFSRLSAFSHGRCMHFSICMTENKVRKNRKKSHLPAPRSSIPNYMKIWTRLIVGPKLKLPCRCLATFFCDAVFVFFSLRHVAVWTVPQRPPHCNGNGFSVPFLSRYF